MTVHVGRMYSGAAWEVEHARQQALNNTGSLKESYAKSLPISQGIESGQGNILAPSEVRYDHSLIPKKMHMKTRQRLNGDRDDGWSFHALNQSRI
jgi:hypothetical protein